MAVLLDGATVLDEELFELRRDGATVPLEPQAFDVLSTWSATATGWSPRRS